MKLKQFVLGLTSLSSCLLVTPAVLAQCVQADVAVQYNISGSHTPTERDNDVDLQSDGACQGNASVTTGVQGNEGGRGEVRQSRVVRHRFQGDRNNNSSGGSTVQIISNPTIDVYNAADDL